MTTCIACDGTGKKPCPRCNGKKALTNGETCMFCREDGKVTCSMCDGKGYRDDPKHYEREIIERIARDSGDTSHHVNHDGINRENRDRM